MKQAKLAEMLRKHDDWLNDRDGGERADLQNADLQNADLRNSNLQNANLQNADLRFADLRFADLYNADLLNADLLNSNLQNSNLRFAVLYNACGNSLHLKSIQNDKYNICYTSEVMQIGCEQHTIKAWFKFDDKTISDMDTGALEWWKVWKPILKKIIKVSPAKPTKEE